MHHFRLGMRTIKTGIAVLLCILLFHFLHRDGQMIAALSAVFALRQDMSSSFKFGKTRILSNTIGTGAALLYVFTQEFFHHNFWIELFLVPLLVVSIIVFCDGISYNDGIISANATLLIIIFTIPVGTSAFYAIDRVVDTFIGTFIAIFVNYFFKPPRKEQLIELKEHASELLAEEAELESEIKDATDEKEDTQKKSQDQN